MSVLNNPLKSSYKLTCVQNTFSYLNSGGEQDIFFILTPLCLILNNVWMDLSNMTEEGTIRGYYKIDGTNYRLFFEQVNDPLNDTPGFYIPFNIGMKPPIKFTYEESVDEGADRDIPYNFVYQT